MPFDMPVSMLAPDMLLSLVHGDCSINEQTSSLPGRVTPLTV